jgi:catechol 2,3-dioxygenase-like lactoylglutathione lyase family enzyme
MIRGGLVTLFVSDVDKSIRFYVETLGMKLLELVAGRWAVIDAGDGFRVGLHQLSPARGIDPLSAEARNTASPSVGLYSKVPIQDAIAIFENRGVRFETTTDGPVMLAYFRDPDDNVLYLCEGT